MRFSVYALLTLAAASLGSAIAEPEPLAAPAAIAEPNYGYEDDYGYQCKNNQILHTHPKSGSNYCCAKYTHACYGKYDGISCCKKHERCHVGNHKSWCKKKEPEWTCKKNEVKCKHPKSGKKHCCPKWTTACYGYKDGVACCKKEETCVKENYKAVCEVEDYDDDYDYDYDY